MEQQQTVGQRFTQLISHLGISKNAFAASLEKTATVIQHIVDERNKPGFDLLCKVFDSYPNVSKDWLLQGQGPMLNDSAVPSLKGRGEVPAVVASTDSVKKAADQEIPAAASVQPVQPAAAVETPGEALPFVPAVASAPAAPVAPPVPEAPAAVSAVPAASAPVGPNNGGQESLQAALYAQQLAHQLTLAEMRNQHLQEQQRLMQQMLDLMQRQLAK